MDAQTAYNKFKEIYIKHYKLYNTAYPLKSQRKLRKNEHVYPKPWILHWLKDTFAQKQNTYHEFVKNPSPES